MVMMNLPSTKVLQETCNSYKANESFIKKSTKLGASSMCSTCPALEEVQFHPSPLPPCVPVQMLSCGCATTGGCGSEGKEGSWGTRWGCTACGGWMKPQNSCREQPKAVAASPETFFWCSGQWGKEMLIFISGLDKPHFVTFFASARFTGAA